VKPSTPATTWAGATGWGAGVGADIGVKGNVRAVSEQPGILARGPWTAEQVTATWHEEAFEPSGGHTDAADDAITALRERGSPSHDGVAARLVSHTCEGGALHMELQPIRWALRLVEGDASDSVAALCVVRDGDGRWLAGRRAAWLSSWAGRWALGAGGAVDPYENPVDTLSREMQEEWQLVPERLQVEALIRLPHHLVMLIGQAWVPSGSEVVMDPEHDAYAWWPADPADWPEEADEPLRRMASMLA
jgi:ADP-ribose pyrophosphatase YjhB (NUDIX family)